MNIIKSIAIEYNLVGSRDICPENSNEYTDYDYLILTSKVVAFIIRIILLLTGYRRQHGGITYFNPIPVMTQTTGFQVWKRKSQHTTDMLLTTDYEFFDKFMKAHNKAKKLKITNKAERLVIFQKIIYDNDISVDDMQKYLDDRIKARESK